MDANQESSDSPEVLPNAESETENVPDNDSLTLEDLETSRENSSTEQSARTTDSNILPEHQSDGTRGPESTSPTRSNQSPRRRRTTHLRSYLSASADTVDVNGLLSALLSSLHHRADGASSRGAAGTSAREAAGGYPEDMFHPPLTDEDRQQYECSICLQVACEAKECLSGHLFCASCILIWSLSGGAARAKCPVCRSPGKYRPAEKVHQALSGRMVKCLAEGCLWTGQMKKYRSHKVAKHGRDTVQLEGDLDSTSLTGGGAVPPTGDIGSPSYVMPRLDVDTDTLDTRGHSRTGRSYDEINGNLSRGRQRLQQMFASFEQRLVRRRRNIDAAYREREENRRESMREVETLGRRLDSVSSNLMRLLDNMSGASQRYRRYIREIPTIPDMPSLQLPNHIPNSSRELREHIAANQNANSRGRNRNQQREPVVTDLSNQSTRETGSYGNCVSMATRGRGRQSAKNSIYKSANLVAETKPSGPSFISTTNTPRLRSNQRITGASRLTGRSQETSTRLSLSHSHQVDRQRFNTTL